MRAWWRWAFRGAAVLAFAAAGVLLALHPSASYPALGGLSAKAPLVTIQCLSPFDRLTGGKMQVLPMRGMAACSAATNARERDVDALGAGGVVLVGLSFLPLRRAMAKKPLVSSLF